MSDQLHEPESIKSHKNFFQNKLDNLKRFVNAPVDTRRRAVLKGGIALGAAVATGSGAIGVASKIGEMGSTVQTEFEPTLEGLDNITTNLSQSKDMNELKQNYNTLIVFLLRDFKIPKDVSVFIKTKYIDPMFLKGGPNSRNYTNDQLNIHIDSSGSKIDYESYSPNKTNGGIPLDKPLAVFMKDNEDIVYDVTAVTVNPPKPWNEALPNSILDFATVKPSTYQDQKIAYAGLGPGDQPYFTQNIQFKRTFFDSNGNLLYTVSSSKMSFPANPENNFQGYTMLGDDYNKARELTVDEYQSLTKTSK